MTESELQAIEARSNAASQAPWAWEKPSEDSGYRGRLMSGGAEAVLERSWCDAQVECSAEDAAFIAHAREDIPRLIAALRSERERNESLVNQEVGRAMDCARHERLAREDERDKCIVLCELLAAEAKAHDREERAEAFFAACGYMRRGTHSQAKRGEP